MSITNETILHVDLGKLEENFNYLKSKLKPKTKIIGVDPEGAPSMSISIEKGENTELSVVDKFVDGASVKKVGDLNFKICQEHLDEMATVHEGKICQTILDMYNKDARARSSSANRLAVLFQNFAD